jgi:alkanesulfonate monooxygenase SsuD/methylene tetrahydromethanopterin reductase-like flavin-dependent oxidoreductase (luciferase family)
VVLAGSLGVGSLNFTAGTDEVLADKVRAYREAIAGAAQRDTIRVNNHFACTPTALVLEDDRTACRYGFRGARFFGEALATYFFSPTRIVGPLEVARDQLSVAQLYEAMTRRGRAGGPLTAVIGDPAAAREAVGRFQAAGVDELILVMQMATIPQAVVLQSLRTFAEKVMPFFQESGTRIQ